MKAQHAENNNTEIHHNYYLRQNSKPPRPPQRGKTHETEHVITMRGEEGVKGEEGIQNDSAAVFSENGSADDIVSFGPQEVFFVKQ